MVALNGKPAVTEAQPALASSGARPLGAIIKAVAPQSPVAATDGTNEAVVLRDPGLDEYLLAHQRFSPSVYSTAQFARSSTFANDSGK
jgi:sigma-E factor negative regulatory protein RseA